VRSNDTGAVQQLLTLGIRPQVTGTENPYLLAAENHNRPVLEALIGATEDAATRASAQRLLKL
jgi:hypothetical protein